MNLEPSPNLDRTSMEPPMSFMREDRMESPNPVPPCLR